MTRILGFELATDHKASAAFAKATASVKQLGVTVDAAATKNVARLAPRP